MPIEIRCPGCQARLRIAVPDQAKRIRCPKCGRPVSGTTASSGPSAPTSHQESNLLDQDENIPSGPTLAGANNLSAGDAEGPRPASIGATSSSQASALSAVSSNEPPNRDGIPATLGGHQVLRELGRGGMGKVFLARQKSLDRLVAMKVMNADRARDPGFVARFTREAYAAAQLVHHHIVQIYDIGADQGWHFFTMEYVKGESLTDLVRREGKLDPDVAAGYILQAARGLKFGHDLGMVHRDVKPDNLLLNDQGIVKVADLGLVKLPHVEEPAASGMQEPESELHEQLSMATRAGVGVGTPTYMAPEQGRDAAHVDARADIYSLGCTFYALLTGRPPFVGKTTAELLSKHATAAVTPAETYVKRIPKALSIVLGKMLAKKPEDRYANMDGVIAALEKHLGIQQEGAFTSREEHAELLEQGVKQFNEASLARLRNLIMMGSAGGAAALLVLCLLMRWLWPAAGILGFAVLTPLAYFVVRGWWERTYLFRKVREWLAGISPPEALYGAGAALLLLFMLYLFHWLWLWTVIGVLGAGLAVAFYVFVDRRLLVERDPIVRRVEKLLRKMRLQGLDELALERFVCKYSGRDWEAFFETLFGYEAKLKARTWLRGEAAQRRHRYAAWRDPLIGWMDAHQRARKEARERKLLQSIQAKALEAQGMQAAEADKQAAQVADVMVAQAALVAEDMMANAAAGPTIIAPPGNPLAAVPEAGAPLAEVPQATLKFQKLLETAQNPTTTPELTLPRRRFRLSVGRLAAALVGARCRFLAGALLFMACILWMSQNEFLDGERLLERLAELLDDESTYSFDRLGEPLAIPLAPPGVTEVFNNFYPGVAGLLLMISAFLGGWKASLVAWPAAILTILGPVLLPSVGPVSGGVVGLAAGLAVALFGLLLRKWKAMRTYHAAAQPGAAKT